MAQKTETWAGVSVQSKKDFEAAYGKDGAQAAWEAEHARDVGSGKSTGKSAPTTPKKNTSSSSSNTNSNSTNNASANSSSNDALAKAMNAGVGVDREKIKANLEIEKNKLDFEYKQLQTQAKSEAERLAVQKAYQEAQVGLLQQTNDLDVVKQQAQQGQFDVTSEQQQQQITAQREQFAQQFGLEQQKAAAQQAQFAQNLALEHDRLNAQKEQFGQQLGFDLLKQGASMGGPQNFVNFANYASGVAANQPYAQFLNNLMTGQQQRLFGPAAVGPTPQVQSLGNLGAILAGAQQSQQQQQAMQPQQQAMPAPTVGSTAADQLASGQSQTPLGVLQQQAQSLVSGAQQLGQQGAGALGAQALESLSPTQLALTQSGFQGAGLDFSSFLRDYANSRVSQGQNVLAA